MPRLSDTMQEGTLARWLKQPGEKVEKGDILAEIETDKATMELEAEDAGVLTRLIAGEGDEIAVGKPIAVISADGEAPDEAPDGARQAAKETADSAGGRETAETEDAETKDAGHVASWRAVLGRLGRLRRLSIFDNPRARPIAYRDLLAPGHVAIVDLSDTEAAKLKGTKDRYAVGQAIPLESFLPGDYKMKVKVVDTVSGKTYDLEREFRVRG